MYLVHAYATPNSVKVPILLEELGVAYHLEGVNVSSCEQQSAHFRELNPNGKLPVLLNTESDFVLTESAAILLYLAASHDRFLPSDLMQRARTYQQLFFLASELGPSFEQSEHFQKRTTERIPLAIAKYHVEVKRALTALDSLLEHSEYVAGPEYSVVDIALFGWLLHRRRAAINLDDMQRLKAWYGKVFARPAVKRAIARTELLMGKLS